MPVQVGIESSQLQALPRRILVDLARVKRLKRLILRVVHVHVVRAVHHFWFVSREYRLHLLYLNHVPRRLLFWKYAATVNRVELFFRLENWHVRLARVV